MKKIIFIITSILTAYPSYSIVNNNNPYPGKIFIHSMSEYMSILKMATQLFVYKELNKIVKFNFCLCGLYKTGEIGIPHHSDTVPTEDDLVVGVSFGAPRSMEWNQYDTYIKDHTNTSEINKNMDWALQKTYLLTDGDVYIFDGESLELSSKLNRSA